MFNLALLFSCKEAYLQWRADNAGLWQQLTCLAALHLHTRFRVLRIPCAAGMLLSTMCALCPPLAFALTAAAAAAPCGWNAAGPLLRNGTSGSESPDEDAEALAGALAGGACAGCVMEERERPGSQEAL